jgi:hypothetical protein
MFLIGLKMSYIVTETSIKPVGGKRRWGEGRRRGAWGGVGLGERGIFPDLSHIPPIM